MKLVLTGFEAAYNTLKAFHPKEAQKVWKKAVNAGAREILKVARPLVPQDSKTLRKSMGVRIKVRRRDGVVVAIVGPRRKFQIHYKSGWRWASKYAHLVHGGRKAFVNKRGVLIPGVAPRPFLKKAMRQAGQTAIRAMRTVVERYLAGNP